jgi:hypothetical protein
MNGETGLSTILEAHLSSDGSFLGGCAYPVKQTKPGGPKFDSEMKILPILRSLSETDFGSSSVRVGELGELTPPSGYPTPIADCSIPK